MKMYCLAHSLASGRRGLFVDGPSPEFQTSWMDTGGLVFEVYPFRPPRLAVEALTASASLMSKEMYLALRSAREDLECGSVSEDAEDLGELYREVTAVLAASPWSRAERDRDGPQR